MITLAGGEQHWYKEGTNQLHRLDGPARITAIGDLYWYINGVLHREDGPAKETHKGGTSWYINGFLHRIGGPALIDDWGHTDWYEHGNLHRLDGPACISRDGEMLLWYVNDKNVKCKTQEEFERLMKLKAFW
jgi:hypothetical protein